MIIVWWILIKITIFFYFHDFYCANPHSTHTFLHKRPFWKWVWRYDSTAKGKTVSVIALGYLKIHCRRERHALKKKMSETLYFDGIFRESLSSFVLNLLFFLSVSLSKPLYAWGVYSINWTLYSGVKMHEKKSICVWHRRKHQVKCEINTFHTKRMHARTKHFVGACARWCICGKVIKKTISQPKNASNKKGKRSDSVDGN